MPPDLAKVKTSPGPTVRAGFATGAPLSRTAPELTIAAAILRERANRAYQSHLSRRISSARKAGSGKGRSLFFHQFRKRGEGAVGVGTAA